MPCLFFTTPGGLKPNDGREDYGEDRWATIGLIYSAILYVVYTIRHEHTIRLISAEKQRPTKESNIVKRTLDLKKPPLLSAEQKARLDAVALMLDEQIDYSDAPCLPDAAWNLQK